MEYRAMRRKDRAIPLEECWPLLEQAEYGVLSTVSEDGTPYGIPINYVALDGVLYIHCAKEGRKIDNMAGQPQVSFCVVGATQPVYDRDFTTYFESVVVHGTALPVEDPERKTAVLMALCEKYLPDHMDKAPGSIGHSLARTAIYAITPDHITGKAKRK